VNPSADGSDSQLELSKFLYAAIPNGSDTAGAKLSGSRRLLRPLHVKMTISSRLVKVLVLLLFPVTSCVRTPPSVDPTIGRSPTLRVQLEDGTVTRLEIEEYVVGSILAEADIRDLDRTTIERVVQTQAILARTYALANRNRHQSDGFDLCSTTHCQVYRSTEHLSPRNADISRFAATSTAGLVITHSGIPINAVFHADCGGSTSNSEVAWGGITPPYLRAVDDSFCLLDNPVSWQFTASQKELLATLNTDARTRIGNQLHGFQISEKDGSGRVQQLLVHSDESSKLRGEVFREVITRRFGPNSLKSTRFTVRRQGNDFIFEGRGWGHGIGLCQRGAAARARAGQAPSQILNHYYHDTSLTQYY